MTLLFNSNQKWLRAETSKCSAYFDYIWLCSPSSKLQTCQQNVNSHCHEMKNSHCHKITIQPFSSIPVTQVDAHEASMARQNQTALLLIQMECLARELSTTNNCTQSASAGSYKTVAIPFGFRVTGYLPWEHPLEKNGSFREARC